MTSGPYSGISDSVSVIMPVYNGEAVLARAVASILSQTIPVREILVVDDGSVDHTADAAAGLNGPIRYVSQSNRGPAAARNLGLSLAQGDVIAFLDCDDLWPPGKLYRQLACLKADPDLAVVMGSIRNIAEPDSDSESAELKFISEPYVNFNLGCALFVRRAFDRVGAFNTELAFSEDVDWFLRAREIGLGIRIIDEVTLYYCRHSGSMTARKRPDELELLKILKLSLDRRRGNRNHPAEPLSRLSLQRLAAGPAGKPKDR